MGLNINVRIVSSLLMSERSARRAGLDHGKRTKPARLRLLDSVLPRYSESCLASDLIQIRAFAAGRQPMLLDIIELRSPAIDPAMDDILWRAPRPLDGVGGSLLSGTKSHCSTAFHWTARLIVLCRTIMDNLYSPWSRATRSEQTLQEVSHQLDNWFSQFPLSPAHRPAPSHPAPSHDIPIDGDFRTPTLLPLVVRFIRWEMRSSFVVNSPVTAAVRHDPQHPHVSPQSE